jgi:hypothetical protein
MLGLRGAVRLSLVVGGCVVVGCSVTTNNPPTSPCSPDSTVTGCVAGSVGYSCTGSDTPNQVDGSLSCSQATAGNAGSSLYCCTTIGGTGTCAPDSTVTSCGASGTGYSCTGTETPSQVYPSLACGPGTAGNAGSTVYCCASATGGVNPGTNTTACSILASTGRVACDQCIDAECCAALVACDTPDSAGVDDAGASACDSLAQCLLDCIAGNPGARVPPGTLASCQTLCDPPYSSTEQQNASALVQCQQDSCAAQCQ